MRRLYNAFCELIEAKTDQLTASAEYTRKPDETPEPQREGAYSSAERSGNYEPDELHADQYRIGFTPASR